MALSPTSSHEGPLALRSQVTEITSAQLLASFTTPIEVLPDLGAGGVVLPWSVQCSSHSGTVAYTLAGTMRLSGGVGFDTQLNGVGSLVGSNPPLVSYDVTVTLLAGAYSPATNAAVTLSAETGNPTDGDFAITFTLLYLLLTA